MIFPTGKPETNIRWSQKFSEFKVLVVRRKLSQISTLQVESLNDYDFDSDFEANSENAECIVDYSGQTGTGLYTRLHPPVWQDFVDNATTCQVVEDPIRSSVSGDYLFCSGNESQNAGQTNYYFDCQKMAVSNLPQFDYTRIHPQNDGYVWAYDVWLTPFKPYTFAYFVTGGRAYFKWYGNSHLIQPSWVDGGSLPSDEPVLSGSDTYCGLVPTHVSYYAGVISETTNWSGPLTSNIKIVPTVMDNKIALNVNWFMITNDTNTNLGDNLACSNTYRDDTTISGGTIADDILYEGILRKYYGEDQEVDGEEEEPVFEDRKVLIREIIIEASQVIENVGSSNCNISFLGKNYTLTQYHNFAIKDIWVDSMNECREISSVDVDSDGKPTNATEENKGTMPYGQMAMSGFPKNSHSSIYTGWIGNAGSNHYLNTYANSGNSSGQDTLWVYDFAKNLPGQNATQTDEDFLTQLGANESAIDQMQYFKFANDGYAHVFLIYLDEDNLDKYISIMTYYNPMYSTTYSSSYPDAYNYTPYRITFGTHYGPFNPRKPFEYCRGFITYTGVGTSAYYDTSPREYSNYNSMSALPLLYGRDSYYPTNTVNYPYCNDNENRIPMYIYLCETPTTDTDGEYNLRLAMTQGESVSWKRNGESYGYMPCTTTWCVGAINGDKRVDNPLDKGDNGKISTPNPDENAGAGCDDTSPESLGTNRTHVAEDKPLPPISTNILASGLLSLYTIDNANLNKLGGDLFSNNIFDQIQYGVQKPLDCVLRIAESRISPIVETSDRAIQIGSTSLTARGNRATQTYRTMNCGEVLIQRINGDYTDNDEKIMIYLPYIGFKTLDGNILQNTKLKLEYIFNFLNGTCMANLQWTPVAGNPVYSKAKGKWAYLTSFTGEFLSTFPIGTSSNTGMLSMLMSAGLGAMSHNAYYARAAIRSTPNALFPTFEHTGEFGSNCSNMNNRLTPAIYKFSVRHSFPHNSISKTNVEQKSGKINGLFSSKYIDLSNASGYLQCDNFELKATPTSITNDECEILKNLFNEGVWKE